MGMFTCVLCGTYQHSHDGFHEDIFNKHEGYCDECGYTCEGCLDEIVAGQDFTIKDDGLYHKACAPKEVDDAEILH